MKPYVEQASFLAHEKRYDECAQVLINALISSRPTVNPDEGLSYLRQLIPGMIGRGMHADVAHILWGRNLFNAEPESVRRIWEVIKTKATFLVPGAGSLGKSYSIAAFFLLDWLEDPLYTCVKVVSLTAEHAKRNVFAHIKNLHRQSSIPLPGAVKDRSIQASPDDKQGIHLVAIPPGEDGSGRLQGYHTVPRKDPHPKFGTQSRIRAILDEAEEIPAGVWEDIDNMLITISDVEHIKIGAAANPRDIDSKFGKRCEPKEGWSSVNIEDSILWESKLGWTVVRLDGARCENVVQKKVVYPGLLSYEGYRRYMIAGDSSPETHTMARGWFPSKGLTINVIPRDFMDKAVGQLIFTGPVTYCAFVDLAFEGPDQAPMTIGRFGLALGYHNKSGERINFPQPKFCLQAESQFILQKHDPSGKLTQSPWLVDQIKRHCKMLNIKGIWLGCDRTGPGAGVHDMLRLDPPEGLGPDVIGIEYGSKATDLKIFADSSKKASEMYSGIVTELFFATRGFLEHDYLKISPSMDVPKITEQLCTRRFIPGLTVRVEGKKEYKARGNDSPDEADSLTGLVHLVRLKEGLETTLLSISGSYHRDQEYEPGIVDVVPRLDWNG